MLKAAEEWGKVQECIVKPMRTYQESAKSKKTVASMIEKKDDNKENKKKGWSSILVYVVHQISIGELSAKSCHSISSKWQTVLTKIVLYVVQHGLFLLKIDFDQSLPSAF